MASTAVWFDRFYARPFALYASAASTLAFPHSPPSTTKTQPQPPTASSSSRPSEPTSTNNPKGSLTHQFFEAVQLGVFRGILRTPLEHPFDCMKTRLQAHPELLGTQKVCQWIYNSRGIAGFYAGAVPNTARAMCKDVYRWPMMLLLPGFYSGLVNDSEVSSHLLTGCTLASIESVVICPLERLKVVKMVQDPEPSATAGSSLSARASPLPVIESRFAAANALRKHLFCGLTAVFFRQTVSWVSFLIADSKAKSWMRSVHEYNDKAARCGTENEDTLREQQETSRSLPVDSNVRALSQLELLEVASLVGFINTLFVLPIDCVKTHLQRSGARYGTSMLKLIRQLYLQHGFRCFYLGFCLRFTQCFIHSSITCTLLESAYGR